MIKLDKKIVSIIALVICALIAELFYTSTNVSSDLEHVINSQKSGQMVSIEGEVIKLLEDDLVGDKHQKMILKIGNHTLLIVHNIDIAPRVPVKKGDRIAVNGEYEWNKQGGLVHWTHRSTSKHPAGWIKHKNKTYQ